MNEKTEEIVNDEIELLRVNKDLIKQEKTNGFKIQKSKLSVFLKKLPSNIYKLVVLFLGAVADRVPDFLSKIPILNYGVDAIKAYAEQYVSQVGSDEFFDQILCPLFGVTVGEHNTLEYLQPYWEYTHHNGKYFQVSLVIKTICEFVMEHPALVIGGGALLAGLVVKGIASVYKSIKNKVKFNSMNKKQQEIYLLLKNILKKSRRIKKADNGKILVNDLNITYDIVNYLGEYADMLDEIQGILIRLQEAIENKNEDEYETCRLELENRVFSFDRTHDNILNKQMNLIENPENVKDKTDDGKH